MDASTDCCCLDCYGKFTFWQLIQSPTILYGYGCPICRSGNIHLWGIDTIVVNEYHGTVGTIN